MVGFLQSDPTPKKPKRKVTITQQQKKVYNNNENENNNVKNNEVKEKPIIIPKGRKILDRSKVHNLNVWDDINEDISETTVVAFHEKLRTMDLPAGPNRPADKKNLVAKAAQCFNIKHDPSFMSSWIAGFVELPPQSIKDPECIGDCSQVFFVADCQDNSCKYFYI